MRKTYRQLRHEERIEAQAGGVNGEPGAETQLPKACRTQGETVPASEVRSLQRVGGPGRTRKPPAKRKLSTGTAALAAVLEQLAAGLSPKQGAHTSSACA